MVPSFRAISFFSLIYALLSLAATPTPTPLPEAATIPEGSTTPLIFGALALALIILIGVIWSSRTHRLGKPG